jgi:hypothetical protein
MITAATKMQLGIVRAKLAVIAKRGQILLPPRRPMQPHQVAKMVKFFRGIYRRIALRFDVDESYVHRIANGDRHNLRIQKALDREWVKAQRLFSES